MLVTRSLNYSLWMTKLHISCRFCRIESPHKVALFQEIGQVCSGPWTTTRDTRAQGGTMNEFAWHVNISDKANFVLLQNKPPLSMKPAVTSPAIQETTLCLTLRIFPKYYTFFLFSVASSGPGPPHCRGFTITPRHARLGRTPLYEWSARRRDLSSKKKAKKKKPDIHVAGGIRTLNHNKRAAADPSFRSCCYFDREISSIFSSFSFDSTTLLWLWSSAPDHSRLFCL
jgi:hypothetical protein